MRGADVVARLALTLPQLTGLFTRNAGVLSLSRSGTTVSAQCAADHGLRPGDAVAIAGAVVPIPASSLTRVGPVGTLVTSTDHDLTRAVAPTITLDGAAEAEFVGTFPVIQVKNRRTITFEMADAGPTTATGSPVLEGGESALRDYNSTYRVLQAPTSSLFTFEHSVAGLPNPTGSIEARARPRISAAASFERAERAYTEKVADELWLFVVLGDVEASKSRRIESDATENQPRNVEFRQQLVQPFSVFLFVPSSESVGGRAQRDAAEDLFRPICRSLLFSALDSGLYVGEQGTVQFTRHGTTGYDGSLYVHEYAFEQVVDLTFEDTVGHDLDVAFRDLSLDLFPDLPGGSGTGLASLTAEIDLDDEPL